MAVCGRNRWMGGEGSCIVEPVANVWAKIKTAARKGDNVNPDMSQFVCQGCGRACLSNAGI